MKNNRFYLIAALLGIALAGCQKAEELNQNPAPEKTWTLTVQATLGADTRGLDYDGTANTLHSFWKYGEKVAVYNPDGVNVGTLTVTSADDVDPATLSGEISVDGLEQGSELTLLFRGLDTGNQWTYLGQDGSTPDGTIANSFDYATATVTVASLDPENNQVNTTTQTIRFTNEQSVYRFGFKVSGSAIAVKTITLASDQNKVVRTLTDDETGDLVSPVYGALFVNVASTYVPNNNLYFMSVRNESSATTGNRYSFTVVGSNNELYEGEKVINKALANGKLYNASVNVSQKVYSPASGEIDNDEDVL